MYSNPATPPCEPDSSTAALKPFAISHQYWVQLSDGERQSFSVVAGVSRGGLDLTVALPSDYDEVPEAVPTELLDRVQQALGQVREKIALADLSDLGA
ncbi:MAG: hypothetical protein HY303_06590 [Candidatus Wallbacteria bacterium]|nr:hypothetical protein [Candidatus Wallbacteria bacterium]